MKIAIAAEHANIPQPTGVEHYTRELIRGLARIDTTNQYILYVRTAPLEWLKTLPGNFVVKWLPSPFLWTQLRLSLAVICDSPDALLITSFSMPVVHPRNTVITIHDMAWLLFPETEKSNQQISHYLTHYAAKLFARRLISVSEATKRDLVERFNVPSEKLITIHHGFSQPSSSGSTTNNDSGPYMVKGDDLPKRFIVALGTLQPRKNLLRLIEGFVRLKEQSNLPHALVIAGRRGWMCDEVIQKIQTTKGVIHMGYVEDRFALLRRADLLVQCSLYEGFGLSILDAFAQRVPVVCSNISSLPEVAGDAAELCDPHSVESIAKAMMAVLSNPSRAEQLRNLGTARLAEFSWDECARKTLAVLEGA